MHVRTSFLYYSSNIPLALAGIVGAAVLEFTAVGRGVGAFGTTPGPFCTDEASDDLAAAFAYDGIDAPVTPHDPSP